MSKDFPSLAQAMKIRGIGAKTVKTAGPGTYLPWKDALEAFNRAEAAYAKNPSPENLKVLQQASHARFHPPRRFYIRKPQ